MVISLLKSGGIRCQASGFSLTVDPASRVWEAVSSEGEQDRLILKTEIPTETIFPASSAVIALPGEYEVSGVAVRGIPLGGESNGKALRTIYLVDIDDIRLCFLGSLTEELKGEALEKLEEVDVLFLPVGAPFISEKQALALIKQIEPRLVIPIAAKNVKSLAEELGGRSEPEEKLTIKSKDLGEEGTRLVWLKEK